MAEALGEMMLIAERRSVPREGSYWRHVKAMHLTVIYRMQPTFLRLMLAWASLFAAIVWTVASLADSDYKSMNFLVPLHFWSAAFFVHWIAVTWRILDIHSRVGWALIINSYGLFLWLVATIAIALDSDGYAHGLAACVVLCLFSGFALYRTGLTDEPITP